MDHPPETPAHSSPVARLSTQSSLQAIVKQSREPDIFSTSVPSPSSPFGSPEPPRPEGSHDSAPSVLPPWKRRRLDDLAVEDTISRIRHAFARARAGNFVRARPTEVELAV